MALSDLVKTRLGGASSRRLIELTNNDGSGTAIDDDVLGAACDDAEGHFIQESGITPDIAKKVHVRILCMLAIAYLEQYRGRDAQIVRQDMDLCDKALAQLRTRRAASWKTSSVLSPSDEKDGAKPDMDRRGPLRITQMTENRLGGRKYYDYEDDE